MNAFAPLVADVGDLLGILVGILFVIIAVVGQLIAKWREMQEAGRRAPGGVVPGPPKREGPLEDEIGDFLREAAARRAGRRAQPARQPGPPPPRATRRQPPKPPPARPSEKPLEAELVEPVGQLRGRLVTREPRALPSQLGQEAAHADDRMAGHLHSVFDHQVGALVGTPGDSAKFPSLQEAQSLKDQITPMPSTSAAGLAALFANADGVRQAILINEILQRPEHRWS